MCQRITCRKCGKPSFAGCGRHVESVLGDVPVADSLPRPRVGEQHVGWLRRLAGPAEEASRLRQRSDPRGGGHESRRRIHREGRKPSPPRKSRDGVRPTGDGARRRRPRPISPGCLQRRGRRLRALLRGGLPAWTGTAYDGPQRRGGIREGTDAFPTHRPPLDEGSPPGRPDRTPTRDRRARYQELSRLRNASPPTNREPDDSRSTAASRRTSSRRDRRRFRNRIG